MSLRFMVMEMVNARGSGNADDLWPELSKHGFTREQVVKALHNARRIGWLYSPPRKPRKGIPRGVKFPMTYYPVTSAMARITRALLQEQEQQARPKVASVWELGSPKTTWPDPPAVRKINTPLGPWNTEGA